MSGAQIFFAVSALIVGLASLLMRLASTPPDTAFSNISLWAKKAGLHAIPEWLLDRNADNVAQVWAVRIRFIGIVVLIISGTLWYYQSKTPTAPPRPIPLADQDVHGELKPADDPTPPNGCDGLPMMPPNTIKILIGDNAFGASGFGKSIALEIGTCEAASIERTPSGVFINAQFVDSDDNQVVRILRNKIDALNGETYTARQSIDQGSLTVTNKHGVELFYARYLNKQTVRIRGFFGCGGRAPILVRDEQPVPGLFISHGCVLNSRVGIHLN